MHAHVFLNLVFFSIEIYCNECIRAINFMPLKIYVTAKSFKKIHINSNNHSQGKLQRNKTYKKHYLLSVVERLDKSAVSTTIFIL